MLRWDRLHSMDLLRCSFASFTRDAISEPVDCVLRLVDVVEHQALRLDDCAFARCAADARDRHLHLALGVGDQLQRELKPFGVGVSGAFSMKRSVDGAGSRCQWRIVSEVCAPARQRLALPSSHPRGMGACMSRFPSGSRTFEEQRGLALERRRSRRRERVRGRASGATTLPH